MTRRYTGGFLSAKEQITDVNTANGVFTLQEANTLTAAGNFPTGRSTPQRSLRLRASAGAYLSRTFPSAGNKNKWTYSAWFKMGIGTNFRFIGSNTTVFGAASALGELYLDGSNRLTFFQYTGSTTYTNVISTQVFRDPSAWYHIVCIYDDAQAVASNRVRMFVNGNEITSFATASYPSQNFTGFINEPKPHVIGAYSASGGIYGDGYLTEVNFIDGQALTPTSFGETDAVTGTWVPKRYTGAYGANGFWLDFRNPSNSSSLGQDSAYIDGLKEQNNFWTTNNISVSAGVTYDSMVDVPGLPSVSSQTDVGGVQRGNYCTFNPLAKSSGVTTADGNLAATGTSYPHNILSSIALPSSGKFYAELFSSTATNSNIGIGFGVQNAAAGVTADWNTVGSYKFYASAAPYVIANGTGTAISAGYTNSANQTFKIAADVTNGKVWIGQNSGWWDAAGGLGGDPSTGANPTFTVAIADFFIVAHFNSNSSFTWTGNFGQRPFAYTPPAGFKSLNTTNLPNPVIKRSSDHFDVKTYTGNGNALSIGTTQKQSSAVQIPYSLRSTIGDAGATTHLTRIPSITGNRRTWTFSAWIKRSKTGVYQAIFHNNGTTGSNYEGFRFMDSDKLQCYLNGGNSGSLTSAASFKDTNRWYHIMYVFDSTHAAPGERQRVYVDGVRQVMTGTAATQNYDSFYNYPTIQSIGAQYVSDQSQSLALDGYFAEVNFVDGQALSPSSFGVFDANNNWAPQRYTGTYGTNGFYLPFNTPSARTQSYTGKFETSSVQYLKTPATSASNVLEFGSNNFTIEFWWCPRVVERQALYHGSFGTDWSVGIDFNGANSNNVIGIWASTNGTGWNLIGADPGGNGIGTIPLNMNQWNHIAFVRNGTTWQSYINGQLDKNLTGLSGSIAARANSAKAVGSWWNPASMGTAGGQISNFRILNGTALYTAPFKPPVGPLTAIANTALLTLQDSTLVDNSANALALTNVASVTLQPADPYTVNIGIGQDASGSGNHFQAHQFGVQYTTTSLNYATPGTYSWTAPAGVTSVKALVVAGGGSGGGYCGAGGGAGGMLYNASYTVVPGTSYTVTVGAGGNGATYSNGGNSVFATLTAVGGGHGATGGGSPAAGAAGNGGSGGGGGSTGGYTAGAAGTAGQGWRGGDSGGAGGNYSSGGGGGAGGPGQSTTTAMPFGGNGGIGLACDITGIPTYYAGGGGGGVANNAGGGGWVNRGRGGLGGGGDAGTHDASGAVLYIGKHGTNGLGGGGGGSNRNYGDTLGLNGGHGVVILSYSGAASYTGPGANSSEWQDNMLDESPANYTDSTGTHSNYCTMNAGTASSYVTVSKGGTLVYGNTSTNSGVAVGTMGVTKGKWYWETTITAVGGISYAGIGISNPANNAETWGVTTGATGGAMIRNSSAAFGGYGALTGNSVAFTTGDIIGVALDADNGALYYHKNGTWMNSGVPTSGNSKTGAANGWAPGTITAYPAGGGYTNSVNTFNFGQRPFAYTPPAGFKELNNTNLQNVGVTTLPDTFGNFVNTPDLVWLKNRTSGSYGHRVTDTVRGPTQQLLTHDAGAQTTDANGLQAFYPNGFIVGSGGDYNTSGHNYVSWNWNRGKTAGFDIVAYSGTGVARSVSHSLGTIPKMIVVKQISTGSNSWFVYHASVGPSVWTALNLTNAATSDTTVWNNNAPTASEFFLGTNTAGNGASAGYIAYLWAEVPGFSKFGSYVGNGAADGPYINCGFRPRWIMVKSSTSVQDWKLIDTARNPVNPATSLLGANIAAAEDTNSVYDFDILSNGFKVRNTYGYANTSGATYIYAAFAEAPFKYANAR